MIRIYANDEPLSEVSAFFGAPVTARKQQGLIRMWSVASGEQGKHILYTLAQRAMVELDDGTLNICWQPRETKLKACYDDLTVSFSEGAMLAMTENNQMTFIAHEGVNINAMVREFHRYATRMIRLDVP